MNNASERLWILGASDPEMTAIEDLLQGAGEAVGYATVGGVRVHPGNAYVADALPHDDDSGCIAVECGWADGPKPLKKIDHHRQGDPGFGGKPKYFLRSSSIGQVIDYLVRAEVLGTHQTGTDYSMPVADLVVLGFHRHGERWRDIEVGDTPPGCAPTVRTILWAPDGAVWEFRGQGRDHTGYRPESPDGRCPASHGQYTGGTWRVQYEVPQVCVLAAAADHCLGAAYRGECPGVDVDALMQWRIETRAAHQGRPTADLLADVQSARQRLAEVDSDDLGLRDMRGEHIPELPEAAVRDGVAYLATVADRDGRLKDVVGGTTTESQVAEWMSAQKACGREVYGDPARGFAGAYHDA